MSKVSIRPEGGTIENPSAVVTTRRCYALIWRDIRSTWQLKRGCITARSVAA
jgi:hypothetical protein